MSTLSQNDVSHLAHLARLALTDEEQQRFAGQLSTVVGYIDQLTQVDTQALPALATSRGAVLAADIPRTPGDPADISSEQLLASSPRPQGRFFTVRAVLDGDGGSS